MRDKICLITGANSGVGKVTARELAKRGAHMIMLCRNEEKAERANVSSEAHRFAKLNFNNLQYEKGYSGLKAYCLSKLCNILFTRELSKRLRGSKVVVNALHPGSVASNFGKGANSFLVWS